MLSEVVRASELSVGDQIQSFNSFYKIKRIDVIHGCGTREIYSESGTKLVKFDNDLVARILPEPVEVREFWRVSYEVQRTTVVEVFWTPVESEPLATKKEGLEKLVEIRRIFGRDCVRNSRLRKICETILHQEEVKP